MSQASSRTSARMTSGSSLAAAARKKGVRPVFSRLFAAVLPPRLKLDSSSLLYQTEDGKHWAVKYSKPTDGAYEYCPPEETK